MCTVFWNIKGVLLASRLHNQRMSFATHLKNCVARSTISDVTWLAGVLWRFITTTAHIPPPRREISFRARAAFWENKALAARYCSQPLVEKVGNMVDENVVKQNTSLVIRFHFALCCCSSQRLLLCLWWTQIGITKTTLTALLTWNPPPSLT